MLTGIVFPQSLVIICTNDNSVHNKSVKIHKNDIVRFLTHCNNHGIRVKIEENASYSIVYIKFICRYIEMNSAELYVYKERLDQSIVAGEFRGPLF